MGAGTAFQLAIATSTKKIVFLIVYKESVFKVLVVIYILNVWMILKVYQWQLDMNFIMSKFRYS
jgi:hypothetical protein